MYDLFHGLFLEFLLVLIVVFLIWYFCASCYHFDGFNVDHFCFFILFLFNAKLYMSVRRTQYRMLSKRSLCFKLCHIEEFSLWIGLLFGISVTRLRTLNFTPSIVETSHSIDIHDYAYNFFLLMDEKL